MSTPLLPGPIEEPDDSQQTQSQSSNQSGSQPQSEQSPITSPEKCLEALSALPRLVVMGFVSATQANTLTRIYQTMINAHERRRTAPQASLPEGMELGRILQSNPELATLLEPILSREQIQSLMREEIDDAE